MHVLLEQVHRPPTRVEVLERFVLAKLRLVSEHSVRKRLGAEELLEPSEVAVGQDVSERIDLHRR